MADLVSRLLCDQPAVEFIERVITAAHAYLGMELTFLAEFVGARQVLRAVHDPDRRFPLATGTAVPRADTYCDRLTRGRLPNIISDARHDPLVSAMPVTEALDVGAYIGVGIYGSDGRLYGTLCGISHAARPDLRQRDVCVMQMLAAIIGEYIAGGPREATQRRPAAEQVARTVNRQDVGTVFQPIMRLADKRPIALEALARFDNQDRRPPDEVFEIAWDIGLGLALDLLAVRTALNNLTKLPASLSLAINVDPRTAISDELAQTLSAYDTRRILVELTEHTPVNAYPELTAAMNRLRQLGARFAIDDVGAGFTGLNHIVRVAPDVIKLDRFLTTGVDEDNVRHALALSAAAFAATTYTTLIAEGIETPAELASIRAAGIRYGQGFLLGPPTTLDPHSYRDASPHRHPDPVDWDQVTQRPAA